MAPVDAKTVARAIQRFYDLGIRPDWWKLEPAGDAETWANIERAIETQRSPAGAAASCCWAFRQPAGRTDPVLRARSARGYRQGLRRRAHHLQRCRARWFKGEIDDEAARRGALVQSSSGVLVDAWRSRQESAYEIAMSTVRLTAAQACVRYLANQFVEVETAARFPTSPASGRFSVMATSPASAKPARRARRAADVSRAQRTSHGARGDRVRQADAPPPRDDLHHLDRPGRHQHGDRRGAGARKPAAGAVHARRCLRLAPPRSGAAADRGFRRRDGFRQ